LHCADVVHISAITQYSRDISEACLSAAKSAIPCTSCSDSRGNSRRVPGWTEIVEPARQKSLFWHNMWNECDRPRTGVVAECMRRTRARSASSNISAVWMNSKGKKNYKIKNSVA